MCARSLCAGYCFVFKEEVLFLSYVSYLCVLWFGFWWWFMVVWMLSWGVRRRCARLLSYSYGCELEFLAELFWIVDFSSVNENWLSHVFGEVFWL